MAITGNWTLFYDWSNTGSYSSTSMTINSNGTWTNGQGASGGWVQNAGMLLFDFSSGKTTYGGNWVDKSVTGINTTFGGLNGSFYMLQAGAPTEIHEEKLSGHKDASGK